MKEEIYVGVIRASLEELNKLVSKDLGYPVRFLADESTNWQKEQCIALESEPLPQSYFGIFNKMISKASVNSFNPINWENGRIVFIPHFSYEHYGHGSNGHEMYDPSGERYFYEYKEGSWERVREG
ncbi:hypothetical protein LCGC14_1901840 [marine sediment metagenome]|uniref:Uncharacterized protein n=1 Tax=marine sediment metagenome TaxID=412755 RepID=A0A0F9FWK1_9ZZZZ